MNGANAREIEAIVRAVLAELGHAPTVPRAEAPTITGRLLALRHVEALPPGTREVRLAAGTVVTPLARDRLKQSGITLQFVAPTATSEGGEWGFAIESASGIAAALRRNLLAGSPPWSEVGGDAGAAASWVAEADERAAVVLTDEASVATWMAHRFDRVRAATVAEAVAVERAARHLGANLLAIEPAGHSIHSLKHLFATFRRAGIPTPPANLSRGPQTRARGHEDRRGDRPLDAHAGPSQPPERALRDRLAHAAGRVDGGLNRSW